MSRLACHRIGCFCTYAYNFAIELRDNSLLKCEKVLREGVWIEPTCAFEIPAAFGNLKSCESGGRVGVHRPNDARVIQRAN